MTQPALPSIQTMQPVDDPQAITLEPSDAAKLREAMREIERLRLMLRMLDADPDAVTTLVRTLQFIKNECDWEPGSGGDIRIGVTILQTLQDLETIIPGIQDKAQQP